MEVYPLEKQVRTDKNGYETIVNLYDKLSNCPSKQASIDFSACSRFDANLSAVLGAIIAQLEENGNNIWITPPTSPGVKRILSRNHFLKAFDIQTTNGESESFIKYEKFSFTDDSKFKKYINDELINKQKFPQHTELAGQKITESIYEIYANAITHGGCSHVYSCGEYDGDGSTLKLNMTIVNCGCTIYQNVNNYFSKQEKEPIDSCESIKWAMEEGNTTKLTTGGLGLSILYNFITLNKGSIQIISHDGMYEYRDGDINTDFLSKPFPGTIVNMQFNFNDNKFYYMEEEQQNVNDLL